MASGTQTFPIAYSYNGHSTVPPPMSIMPYFNTYNPTDATQADPDGWVVCNGVRRTVTDGRYAVIAPILNRIMGVNTNDDNNITPPDLRGDFLYGATNTDKIGSANAGINEIGGSTTTTLTTANLPSHSHSITDPGHTHNNTLNDPQHTHTTTGTVFNTTGTTGTGFVPSTNYSTGSNSLTVATASTGITINNASATTGITRTQNAGSGTAFSILPPYITINYIMKY